MPAAPQHMMKKRVDPLKVVGIVAGSLLGLIGIAYLAGSLFFSSHFLPNTTIGGVDVSFASAEEASSALLESVDARSVSVSGQGVSFQVSSSQAGMTTNASSAVESVLASRAPWSWPLELTREHDADDALRSSCDAAALVAFVADAVSEHNASAEQPVDASLYFNQSSGTFEVSPGSLGEVLDESSIAARVIAAFGSGEERVYLTSEDLVPQKVAQDSPKLARSREEANEYLACNLGLTVAGSEVARLDAATVVGWLTFADNGQVLFDAARLREWCKLVEGAVDDVGSTRSYTREDGKYVTVSGGSYGWLSDGAALEAAVADAIRSKAVGSIEVPLKQTASVFARGGREWGPRYIDVDLSEQYVRFYGSDGSIIWSSPCISGASGAHDTPTGTWFVNNKALNQTLIGLDENHDGEPDYRTPVTYWMPFEGNLVAFHDADWQPGFGGSMYREGYGSHGCINLPPSAAASLFEIIQIGDVVVVHY